MSGSIYQVGVHLHAQDGVSGVLANLSKSLLGLHGGVEKLQKGFSSLQIGLLGAAAVAAGVKIGHVVESLVEHGMALEHWKSQLSAAGFTSKQVADATGQAWAVAGKNMNTTAADNLKNIIELNKATGDLAESIKLLPAFSVAENVISSVKAQDLHSKLSGNSTQTLNFARGLEELGVTQMGKTPEEREANIKRYAQAYIKTMIASRGLFDGNALYAMTNNSGGAAQNWDFRMATQVAPVLGEIMKSSKLGNADYMAIRSYQGGHITSDAAEALVRNHLAKLGDADDDKADVYKDKRGFHLKANSHFAQGMEVNLWDWSARILSQMKANGVDTSDQHAVNKIINEIGSNKSTTMMMRAILEPLTRLQIDKELKMQAQVPDGAAGIQQQNDPWMKVDALKKKWDDFLTALGGPLVDPAMHALDKMTRTLNDMAQFLVAHPETAALLGKTLAGLSAGLTALGSVAIGSAVLAAIGPAGWLILGIGALGTALVAFRPQLNSFHDYLVKSDHDVAAAIKSFGVTILDVAKSIGQHFIDAVKAIPDQISSAIADLGHIIADKIKNAIGSIGGFLGGLFHKSSFEGGGPSPGGGLLTNAAYITSDGSGDVAAAAARAGIVNTGGGVINIYAGGGGGGGGFMNASYGGGGGGGGRHFAGGGWAGGGAGSNAPFSNAGIEAVRQYIRSKAASLGIDPNIAERVARSEGLNRTLGAGGDGGTSDGPYQLHVGGGIGDLYQRLYGRSIHDKSPQALKDQIDFALGHASKNGWGAWYGARNSGIGNWQGIGTYHGPQSATRMPPPPPPKATEHHITVPVHLDGKVMAKVVTKHQTKMAKMPHAIGGQDDYGSWASPGTTMMPA